MPPTSLYAPLPPFPPSETPDKDRDKLELDRDAVNASDKAYISGLDSVSGESPLDLGVGLGYSTPKLGDSPSIPTAGGLDTSTPGRIPLSPDQEMSYTENREEEEGDSKPEGDAFSIWGPGTQWFLFVGIGLSAYIYSLDGLTSWQFLQYATSSVQEHSLSGTLGTAQAIIIAVGKPLMAKLADVIGRAETFILVTVLYILGYSIIATAHDIRQIAIGEVFYAFGYTGLQILQQIVVADMTNLRWRGLVTGLVSAPFIINNFVSPEIAQRILPDWRWGYAMFAVLVPIFLLPIILALLWGQHQVRKRKRNRLIRPHLHRHWSVRVYDSAADMDMIGLLLIAASLSLFLLPLGLIRQSNRGLHNPSMLGMIILGFLLFPLFVVYESRFPAKPVVPIRWFKRAPVLGACMIGFLDFVSFYLQYTYLYPYVYVTREWNYRELGYFAAVQSLVMTIFGIVGGALMWATHRFKSMLFLGLLIRLCGCLAMLHARSPTGTTPELVLCQVLQGIGGGFSAISIQVSAQASVAHADVATITALVLLVSEVGNSVGSALSTGMWAFYMPVELERFVPSTNTTLLEELYGDMTEIVRFEKGDPIRDGAELAYHSVMNHLVIAASAVAILPPLVCLWYIKDIHLGRTQKAREKAKREREARRAQRAAYAAGMGEDVEEIESGASRVVENGARGQGHEFEDEAESEIDAEHERSDRLREGTQEETRWLRLSLSTDESDDFDRDRGEVSTARRALHGRADRMRDEDEETIVGDSRGDGGSGGTRDRIPVPLSLGPPGALGALESLADGFFGHQSTGQRSRSDDSGAQIRGYDGYGGYDVHEAYDDPDQEGNGEEDGIRVQWGSPTGDSPRRERNADRRWGWGVEEGSGRGDGQV